MCAKKRAGARVLLQQASHGNGYSFGFIATGQLVGGFLDQSDNFGAVDRDHVRMSTSVITDVLI
jgi:hypothetical protein